MLFLSLLRGLLLQFLDRLVAPFHLASIGFRLREAKLAHRCN